jgi:hypothetical protein
MGLWASPSPAPSGPSLLLPQGNDKSPHLIGIGKNSIPRQEAFLTLYIFEFCFREINWLVSRNHFPLRGNQVPGQPPERKAFSPVIHL